MEHHLLYSQFSSLYIVFIVINLIISTILGNYFFFLGTLISIITSFVWRLWILKDLYSLSLMCYTYLQARACSLSSWGLFLVKSFFMGFFFQCIKSNFFLPNQIFIEIWSVIKSQGLRLTSDTLKGKYQWYGISWEDFSNPLVLIIAFYI